MPRSLHTLLFHLTSPLSDTSRQFVIISPPSLMTTQTIDDQDGSHVKYVGNWIRGGTPGKEYEGTVASSTRVNDSFTVAFKGNLTLIP